MKAANSFVLDAFHIYNTHNLIFLLEDIAMGVHWSSYITNGQQNYQTFKMAAYLQATITYSLELTRISLNISSGLWNMVSKYLHVYFRNSCYIQPLTL